MRKFGIVLLISLLSFGLFAQDAAEDDSDMFGSDDVSSEEDDLFGGASSDDEDMFGGTSTDDEDMFGGSSDEDDLFSTDESSESSLFGGSGGLIDDITDSGQTSGIADILLGGGDDEYDVLSIGGSFNVSFSESLEWNLSSLSEDWTPEDSFEPTLSGSLYFDARPDLDTRGFLKLKINSPLYTAIDDDSTASIDETRDFSDIVNIHELFVDFNIDNDVFFRLGKQTISYGVGRFYRPADVFNLTEVDPDDPDAELEGPVSLKAHYPFGINNAYLYLVTGQEETSLSSIAVAPIVELVLDATEVAVGAYYRADQAPRLLMTLSGGLGDVNYFGEAVLGYGTESGLKLDDTDELFYSLTAGGSYSYSLVLNENEENQLTLFRFSLNGQYLYNYGAQAIDNENVTEDSEQKMIVSASLGSIANTDDFSTGLSIGSSLYLSNGILSGSVEPSWSMPDLENFSLSVGVPYTFSSSELVDNYWGLTIDVGTSIGVSF